MRKLALTIALTLSLTACSTNSALPDIGFSFPDLWQTETENPTLAQLSYAEADWWKQFDDPGLDQMMQLALAHNFTLQNALLRLEEARALRSGASAELWPELTYDVSARRADGDNLFGLGGQASWEADLFNREKYELEARDYEVAAEENYTHSVRTSLLSEVAAAYFDYRYFETQAMLLNRNYMTQQHTADLVEELHTAGLATDVERLQVTAEMGDVAADLATANRQMQQSAWRLDALLGQTPGRTAQLLSQRQQLPTFTGALPLTSPASTLMNRPDVKVAEMRLWAATARSNAARAAQYPDLSLAGLLGLTNMTFGDLFESQSKTWSLGANLAGPLLNFGRIDAQIDAADARQQQALNTVKQTITNGLAEVESALTAYNQEAIRFATLSDTVEQRQRTVELTRLQYEEGLISLLDFLEVVRQHLTSQRQLANAHYNYLVAVADFYKAVGGGWNAAPEIKSEVKDDKQ